LGRKFLPRLPPGATERVKRPPWSHPAPEARRFAPLSPIAAHQTNSPRGRPRGDC